MALERTGVEIDSLAHDVNKSLYAACAEVRKQMGRKKPQKLPSGQLGVVANFQTLLAPLLAAAEHEALGLGHNWVGTEHLLLAIVRLADPRLCEELQRHRVTYEKLRKAVLDTLHS